MKYESSILKRLIDTYGVIGNPRYLSEIIKEFIVRGKELYPQLFTYQSDWLAHIEEFGLTPEYTVSYTGQHIYAPNTKEKPVKSAILKGSTKYRDIDTGEVLDVFEDGRNLELVSVRMPVLKTMNNNFFTAKEGDLIIGRMIDGVSATSNKYGVILREDLFFDAIPNKYCHFFATSSSSSLPYMYFYDKEYNFIKQVNQYTSVPENARYMKISYNTGIVATEDDIRTLLNEARIGYFDSWNHQYNEIPASQSNILTVNEDVTLRSNGDVYDELNLLTGRLTQRIDENNEVLAQEVVKTVDLTIHDKDHQKVERLTTFEGGTHFTTSSQDGTLQPTLTVDVVTDLEETLMVCSLEGNTM